MAKKKVTGISSMEDYSRDLLDFGASIAGATIGAKITGGGPGSIIAAGKGADKLRKKFKKATSKVRGY
jgi:hypothetical protein